MQVQPTLSKLMSMICLEMAGRALNTVRRQTCDWRILASLARGLEDLWQCAVRRRGDECGGGVEITPLLLSRAVWALQI